MVAINSVSNYSFHLTCFVLEKILYLLFLYPFSEPFTMRPFVFNDPLLKTNKADMLQVLYDAVI